MYQNPLSILAFFTPFIILYLSKICRFTAYILTTVKKIVAHNSSYYLFASMKEIRHNNYRNKKDPDLHCPQTEVLIYFIDFPSPILKELSHNKYQQASKGNHLSLRTIPIDFPNPLLHYHIDLCKNGYPFYC